MSEEVIEHRTADTMRTAGISKQTRDILMVYASVIDVEQSIYKYYNKYYAGEMTSEEQEKIINACEPIKNLIESYVSKSISEQLSFIDFKDI